MSETQSESNDAARRADEEGSVTVATKRPVTVQETISVDELQVGDVLRELVGDGSPVTVVAIGATVGSGRRVIYVSGNTGYMAVWLWKWSRVLRVDTPPEESEVAINYLESLKLIKTMIEEPRRCDDDNMTTHRLNGLIAQIYAIACQAVTGH